MAMARTQVKAGAASSTAMIMVTSRMMSCACREPRPRHATRRYSLIRPPASVFSDAVLLQIDRVGQRCQRRGAVQGAVRPMLVVVGLVVAQDPPQMGLGADKGAVQELAAASPNP